MLRTVGRACAVLAVVGAMLSPVAASAATPQHAKASRVSSAAAPAALPDPGATRAGSLAFYRSDHVPAPDPGWTGSIAGCNPGDTSTAFKSAVAQRINYFRQMAGVPTITIDPTASALAQKAALIMAAQNNLSHTPPSNWNCWTQAGYDAAGNSNLALGNVAPVAIDQYIEDAGAGNEFTGHRRTVLYPNQTQFGTGDVPAGGNSNALYSAITGSPTRTTRDGYVAWPPAGYVPSDVIFQRWSLSYPGADFSNATVTMTKNGAPYSVTKLPVTNGYRENTLVWAISELSDGAHLPPPASDTTYHVAITGIGGGTGIPTSESYNVIAFDAGRPALAVTDQSFSPASPQLGDHITLSATIKNTGTAPVPANVNIEVPFFDMAANQVATAYLTQPLAVGSSATVSSSDTWTPSQTGQYGFYACADWTFQVVDSPQCYNGVTFVNVSPPSAKPGAPRNVSASAGNASATVTWDAPLSNGGSAITGYTITASPGGASKSVNGSTTSAGFTGLNNGTAYTFTVTASNANGTGPGTASNSVTPTSGATVPGVPQSVHATAGSGSATVTWSPPASTGGSPITQYVVVASPGSQFVTVGGTSTSATVTGLSNGTSYVFYVTAKNAVGTGTTSDPSNSVTPSSGTTVPGAPQSVTATAGNTSAKLTWAAPTSNGGSPITGYSVTRLPGNKTTKYGAAVTSATISGLTNGTTYTFTVKAINAIGAGPGTVSNPVTPQPAPKPTTVQDGQLTYDTWAVIKAAGAKGGAYRATDAAGSRALFTFKSTAISWMTLGGPAMGQAQVLIDGVNKGTVDLYRSADQAVTQTYKGLASKKHTLTIVVLGTHNVASTGSLIAVDALKVGKTVTQETSGKVQWGHWKNVANKAANGGTVRSASTAGSTMAWTFTGTGVDWITATGPAYGQARVLIDGLDRGMVDLHAATQKWKVTRSYAGLASGQHTLTIQVLGTKSTGAKGTAVIIDAVITHSS